MPEQTPQDDPIVSQSLSGPLLITSLLLLVSLVWALYDEFYGLRPWKTYQERFVKLYTAYLEKTLPVQAEREKEVRESAAFRRLEEVMLKAEEAVAPQVEGIDREIRDLDRRIAVLTDTFQVARGQVTALVYEAEVAGSERARERRLRAVEEAKKGPFRATLPVPDGTVETINYTYEELESEYNRLKERKAVLMAQRTTLLAEASALRKQRDAYLAEHLVGLTEQQMRGLLRKMETFSLEIKQIHLTDTSSGEPRVLLVDRCESCHLGAREPVTLTAAEMGGEKVYASHPRRELLKIHDPERFGCSPCHGGNGRATSGVVKAHGRHQYWLWPLFYSENVEAGCQQCHARDMVVEQAEVLNRGKELFRLRGCIGCHRFEGFDDARERLEATRQAIRQLDMDKAERERDIQQSIRAGDAADTNEEAQRLYARAENLRVGISRLDAEKEQLRVRVASLMQEEKRIGPNLKEVRVKLRRDWIPVWLENPHAWRPTTKMPRVRLQEDERKAVAAYIWQSGLDARLPAQPRGNAARGKELFETRGCLACHAVGEGDGAVGGTFAANLSRVGEKANYDFLVRWVHNPRQRTRPYCPLEKRDLTAADYARHDLPFVFDRERATCPNDGELLQVYSGTVMPYLRLTWDDARDIATYLMTLRKQDPAGYPKADYMNDPELKEKGRFWVRHYGCAGCHEIAGFEDEGRIGTDLTAERSKPIERLDFALLTEDAKRGVLPDETKSPRGKWYDHKGFFEQKLSNPAVYDQGKVKEPLERLRMPTPNLTPQDVTALTTFLLGSVEPGYGFPTSYLYQPAGQQKDIQDGWWIVTRYNCMGCHQLRIGQQSVLMTLPAYQTPEGKDQLPPILVGAGARLNPDWLARFLENPALSSTDLNRNGVRTYLKTRMPTFEFSVEEIQTLVRFFQALSAQPQPYIPPKVPPLTDRERTLARQLFTHPAAPCLKCHATGDPAHDRTATAPNFLLAKERLKPGWTQRWMLDPQSLAPGTAMPSGLFRREGDRWVFSGPHPEAARGYPGDHSELLVRYMFQLTPEEQRLLVGRLASAPVASPPTVGLNLVESH